ncbi:hypothetical protein [Polyangium aurulentum]|uniref:hypothetical protein n=1 Tax=Polyangium aurulentum TaxID=2567896 RepID=UPI0010ADF8AB|nr:hypothetical protein [Polyangium aurulentum]UQA57613.1 hypothetical protein E8A73_041090 [Polyangium aurulentum]
MLATSKRLLASPRAPLVIALVAVLLSLPTLGVGLMMDDYSNYMVFYPPFERLGGPRGDWDLFRFLDDTAGAVRAGMDRGFWPWWTGSSLRIAFFRPLASLLHAVDFRLWPSSPPLMHAVSILIYGATALLAGLVYRRILGATVAAGLATLMFALDDAHAMVIAWIANRHAVLSAAFVFAALLAHDHARRDGWRAGRPLAALAFSLGMLAGESALGGLAFLAAYALFLDEDTPRGRILSLAPYAAVTLVWLVVYRALGYGASGGSFYIDPARDPGAFLAATVVRLPALVAAQLAVPPADVFSFVPESKTHWTLLVTLPVVLFVGAALVFALRKDRRAAFFATGMVLSLLPVCATAPNDRLLLLPGLGGLGLVALLLSASREGLGRIARPLVRATAGLFVLVHLVIAPLFLPLRAYANGAMLHGYVERAIASLPGDDALGGRTLVIVNAPDPLIPTYAMAGRYARGGRIPAAVRHLAVVLNGSQKIGRPDAQTLSVTLSEGFFHDALSNVYRNDAPVRVGDRIALEGMVAEVMSSTPDGKRPERVDFHFDRPLDDPSLTWILWHETSFVPFVLPAIGEERTLPAIDAGRAYAG